MSEANVEQIKSLLDGLNDEELETVSSYESDIFTKRKLAELEIALGKLGNIVGKWLVNKDADTYYLISEVYKDEEWGCFRLTVTTTINLTNNGMGVFKDCPYYNPLNSLHNVRDIEGMTLVDTSVVMAAFENKVTSLKERIE